MPDAVERWAPRVLVALALVGLAVLYPDVSLAIWLCLVGALALVAVLRLLSILGGIPALVLGAILVPVLALVGFDALWALVVLGLDGITTRELPRLGPIASGLIGMLLLAAGNLVYFRSWLVAATLPLARAVAISVGWSFILVVVPPAAFLALGAFNAGPPRETEDELHAVSQLELVVVSDEPLEPPGPQDRRGWHIVTWSGDLEDDGVHWVGDAPPAVVSPRADRVVLLAVDGTSPGGATATAAAAPKAEPRRWLAAADQAGPPDTPAFALLREPEPARLATWNEALSSADPNARSGGVYDLARPGAGEPDYIDIALRSAVNDANSEQLLALAARYRPLLFFDGDERSPVPLNIDQLIKHGLIHQCRDDETVPELCPVVDSSGIDNTTDHFAFNPRELADFPTNHPDTDHSVIYVNARTTGNESDDPTSPDTKTIYLDYWWYLPDNPTGAAGGALCGAGFVVGGVTCLDHQSDWEGVTVLVDADAPADAPPLGVAYAAHNHVVRYSWPALRRLWLGDGDLQRFGRRFSGPHQPLLRPLVFIARGTHAAYPRSCRDVADDRSCRDGGVPGIPAESNTSEKPHDGGRPWKGNVAGACEAICLEALPTYRNGSRAARWNAYRGLWGSSDCVLGVVCTKAKPPKSPSRQPRYQHPWCARYLIDHDGARFVRRTRGCIARLPTPDELQRGQRLLALGDSFSSGEGAGDYDPSTDRDDNSCHRSGDAWPQQLARRLDLVALPSWACSGALTGDVTTGRTRGEPERQISQISRIRGNPQIITLTIGGNDAGFADVLRDCVTGDCVDEYVTPAGDEVADRVDRLGARLPSVYRAIRRAAPGAQLLVIDYPRLFPRDDSPRPLGNCSAGKQITAREAAYLNALTERLGTAIAEAAAKADVQFVDVLDAFDGRELRCEGASYVNRLTLTSGRFSASYHPKDSGYRRLAEVIAAQLAERRLIAAPAPRARPRPATGRASLVGRGRLLGRRHLASPYTAVQPSLGK